MSRRPGPGCAAAPLPAESLPNLSPSTTTTSVGNNPGMDTAAPASEQGCTRGRACPSWGRALRCSQSFAVPCVAGEAVGTHPGLEDFEPWLGISSWGAICWEKVRFARKRCDFSSLPCLATSELPQQELAACSLGAGGHCPCRRDVLLDLPRHGGHKQSVEDALPGAVVAARSWGVTHGMVPVPGHQQGGWEGPAERDACSQGRKGPLGPAGTRLLGSGVGRPTERLRPVPAWVSDAARRGPQQSSEQPNTGSAPAVHLSASTTRGKPGVHLAMPQRC